MNDPMRDTCEVVIRIGPRRRKGRGIWESPEDSLQRVLKSMRRQGYEVDLYVRGTWMRKHGGRMAVLGETLAGRWRAGDDGLTITGELATDLVLPAGDWRPAVHYTPPPELVLRGVRGGIPGSRS